MADNGGNADPNPGGGQGGAGGGEKLFTQADVDRMIQQRLAQDRRRRSEEGLTDAERTDLLNQIESLKTQNGNLKTELQQTKDTLVTEKDATAAARRSLKAELINRAIGAAAAKANAVDPSVVGQLLEGSTRAQEVTDEGKPTGRYRVEVRVQRTNADGKEESTWVSPEEGVKSLLEKSPFLVKSQTPQGAGTQPAAQPPAKPPGQLPDGVVKSEMPGVGHLPKGGSPQGATISDVFARAGDSLEKRLAQG